MRRGFDFGRFFYLLPKKLRNMFGIVMPNEVNVILDASGFAYGDQWGAQKFKVPLAFEIEDFKRKKNHKVILLPQALGPFTDGKLRRHMSEIVKHADLIFSRDQESLKYIQSVDRSENLRIAPDFTNQFQTQSARFDYLKAFPTCFIPNAKMLEMKNASEPDGYLQFMAHLIKSAHKCGHPPYLLIHEGQKDIELAKKIKSLSGLDLPIVQPTNAAQVKQAIAVSRLVVSSRFHGLVSALSQNIPVIATGWSHKYQALLQDYGVEDCIFDESKDTDTAESKMLSLLDKQSEYDDIVKTISMRSAQEKSKTEAMWQEVFSIMDDVNE
jgi:colanic acid/amylovoran biosynthesis protein